MNNLRQYAMFPVRLLVILLSFFSSFFVIVMGKPWREEWNEMNVRAYLIEGKNWNAAGFWSTPPVLIALCHLSNLAEYLRHANHTMANGVNFDLSAAWDIGSFPLAEGHQLLAKFMHG
jgi:hypothetical protein